MRTKLIKRWIVRSVLMCSLSSVASNSLESVSPFGSTFESEGQTVANNLLSSSYQKSSAASSVSSNATNSTTPTILLPRDYYIDKATGLAYTKIPGGVSKGKSSPELFAFQPHGHDSWTGNNVRHLDEDVEERALRFLKSTTDTIPPSISNIQPVNGANASSTFTIQATITDNVKVKSATVKLVNTVSKTSSKFTLIAGANNNWTVTVQTVANVTLQMTITATDTSGKTTTSATITFSSSSSTSNSGGGTTLNKTTTVSFSQWPTRSVPVARAAGRIIFDMPNSNGTWATYVCSGTLIQLPSTTASTVPDRSIVMTAGHCVYEDVAKVFARNAMFIPQQDDGQTDRTDRDCTNDALGCINLDYGFVSDEWASRIFPANIGVDYGFYVSKSTVTDVKGKRIGIGGDIVPMVANFGQTTIGNWTYAMGYSYNQDPKFMYSWENVSTINKGLVPNYFLPSSKLSGGSSGGPWTQDDPYSTTSSATAGDGGIVSVMAVVSWIYTANPGVGSSPCYTGGAACVYNAAAMADLSTITGNGQVVDCGI